MTDRCTMVPDLDEINKILGEKYVAYRGTELEEIKHGHWYNEWNLTIDTGHQITIVVYDPRHRDFGFGTIFDDFVEFTFCTGIDTPSEAAARAVSRIFQEQEPIYSEY